MRIQSRSPPRHCTGPSFNFRTFYIPYPKELFPLTASALLATHLQTLPVSGKIMCCPLNPIPHSNKDIHILNPHMVWLWVLGYGSWGFVCKAELEMATIFKEGKSNSAYRSRRTEQMYRMKQKKTQQWFPCRHLFSNLPFTCANLIRILFFDMQWFMTGEELKWRMAVMVNCMCQFNWATGCPVKCYSESVSVFLDDINIWISMLSKTECPFQPTDSTNRT